MNAVVVVDVGNNPIRGFFSYFNQVLYALLYADSIQSRFSINFSNNTTSVLIDKDRDSNNFLEYFFVFKNSITLNEAERLRKEESYFYDERWWFEEGYNHFLQKEHIQKVSKIVKEFIELKPEMQLLIEEFYNKNMSGKKIIACHKRGTDHHMHGGLLKVEYYFEKIDEIIGDYDAVYLATDEQLTLEKFKIKYGDKLIYYDCLRSSDETGVHYGVGKSTPYKISKEVIMDCLLMSKCDFLLKTVSNVSHSVLYFNPKLKYKDIDSHMTYR